MFMALLAEHVDCKIDVGGGVGGADLYANASIAFGITGEQEPVTQMPSLSNWAAKSCDSIASLGRWLN